jgi:glycosyltransferase involved in cell wall biosynthesis
MLHIHPAHFWDFLNTLKGIRRRYVLGILNRVDEFVTLTKKMQQLILKLYPDKPVHILNNPVDVQSLEYKNKVERKKNRLIYLGSYLREKGIYDLVDAVALLAEGGHDVTLDFYGSKKSDRLLRYVSDKRLNGHIRVNGWIDGEEKLRSIHECTVLVLPSHSEGIPNVVLEAMATGTPIVSTLVGGLSEVLEDGRNAVIAKAQDPANLSRKIKLVLEDADLRQRIADNAYLEVLSNYDIRMLKTKIKEVVLSVVPRPRSGIYPQTN